MREEISRVSRGKETCVACHLDPNTRLLKIHLNTFDRFPVPQTAARPRRTRHIPVRRWVFALGMFAPRMSADRMAADRMTAGRMTVGHMPADYTPVPPRRDRYTLLPHTVCGYM